jgi:hypothetical protein
MNYRVSSPRARSKLIRADDAKSAAVAFCTGCGTYEVTVCGPEATTVWRATRFGAVLVRWWWNDRELRQALKSNGLAACDVDTWAQVLEND